MITLAELFAQYGQNAPAAEAGEVVCGATMDSRKVAPGDVFFAVPGTHVDGHDFVRKAQQSGAVLAVVERPVDTLLPQLVVPRVLDVMAPIAAQAYGYPSREMCVWGVTGSNGKSTTTYLIEAVGQAAKKPTGVIGTINYRWPGVEQAAPNTTPFAAELQRLLARMNRDGVQWVAMEASSHAIHQHRIDEVHFAGAIFTNLSPEHLDYHETLDAYREAKSRLFVELLSADALAVFNMDDAAGRRIAGELAAVNSPPRIVGFGLQQDADYTAQDIQLRADGSTFVIRHPGGELRLESHLVGRHNVYNVLGTAALLLSAGVAPDVFARGIAALAGVPGRMEQVRAGQPFTVVVDYCHSPDGLQQALQTLVELPHNRIITVFGCGGDRDRTKRPVMGGIAENYSDIPIVTSDNPRTEDPEAIMAEVISGMQQEPDVRLAFVDRAEAIRHAIGLAEDGDVVLIAGKGHETYQEFADGRVDFDDREVARKAIEALPWNR